MNFLFLFFLLISLTFSQLKFSFNDSTTGFEANLLAYPILNYATETRIGYGAGGRYFYRSIKEREFSTITPVLLYTQNKQLLINIDFDHYYEKSHIYGKVTYKKFPTSFYGIGNSSSFDKKEKYTPKLLRLNLNYERNIAKNIAVGMGTEIQSVSFSEFDSLGVLTQNNIVGLTDNFISGLNFLATYDSRDHKFNSYSGHFTRLQYQLFDSSLGSDTNFSKFLMDVRFFKKVGKLVFAHQIMYETSTNSTPFMLLPRLGGGKSLRGMSVGRYIDKNLFYSQLESRYRVLKKYSITGFVGFGQVWNKSFSDNKLHPVYGIGGRMHYPGKERLTFRADLAFSKDGNQIYLEINEAF